MKKILLIFLLVVPFTFSQNKYMIYFKDKEANLNNALNKNTAVYKDALNFLSAHAIARREKVMGKNNIITYEDLPLSKNYINNLQTIGIKIENQLKWFNAVSAYLTNEQKGLVSALPFVKSVEPVKVIKFTREKTFSKPGIEKSAGGPTRAEYGNAYGQLNLSDVPVVHSKGINGQGIIIGILDNGFIWKNHESLINRNVIAEYNFVFQDSSTAPQPGDSFDSGLHGTKVFSIIGGYKDSSMIGAAYGASFILAKTEDDRSESKIEEDNYAAALEWMERLGADVTTSSLGYNIFDNSSDSYSYKDMDGKTTISAKAAELAFQRGLLTFNAAGNEGTNLWFYIVTPADGLHMIAVGAVDSENNVADFSSRGPTYDGRIKPDVVAQGVDDFGADVSSGFSSYDLGNGTSFATPIAGGIGALLLSAYPYLTNVQARNIILETSNNSTTPDNNRGYGLISAEKAVSFPNISDTSGNYRINKIFFPTNTITDAAIFYSLDSLTFSSQGLSYDGKLKYSFAVPQLTAGQNVYFYFTFTDDKGGSYTEPSSGYYSFRYGSTNVVPSTGNLTPVKNPEGRALSEFSLSQNYPNPFNPATKIEYNIQQNSFVTLKVYNLLGQEVITLVNREQKAGNYKVIFNASKLASGIYMYKIQAGSFSLTKKMVILK